MRTIVRARRVRVLAVMPLLGALLAGAAPPVSPASAVRWVGPTSRPASVSGGGMLFGVAAISARSAWAVGLAGRVERPRTLIERWSGGAWKRVPSPAIASGGLLTAVAVTSGRSAWAVGATGSLYSTKPATLIERWNGTVWRRVPSPSPPAGGVLFGVTVTSDRSAWAVGQIGSVVSGRPKTLILHWNGTAWRRVPSPNPALGGSLAGVAVTSARNAWAVGYTRFPNQHHKKTLIERWNGAKWKLVPSPNLTGDSFLNGVAVTSAGNAWAVGCTRCFAFISGGKPKTLILRWNGSAWRRVPSPNPVLGGTLAGVAVTSARNAWAVGYTTSDLNQPRVKTVIERWNGGKWKLVPSPSPTAFAYLGSVAAASARSAWAVGLTGEPKTVALHWNGTIWK